MTDKPRRTNPASAQNGRAGGRPPKSTAIHIGDKISIRLGRGTEPERGTVIDISRTLPRSIKVQLEDGTEAWIWFG